MAKWVCCTLLLVLALASAVSSGARNVPSGVSDQKTTYYGGGYSGIGDNGLPFGGVGGGVSSPSGNLGFGPYTFGGPGGGLGGGGLGGGGLGGGGLGGGAGTRSGGGSPGGFHFP